jgi:hypothetical protein
LAPDVADAPFLASIAPRPAEAFVEHPEGFAGRDLADCFAFVRRESPQDCFSDDRAIDRLGIVGSDDPPG